MIEDSEIKVTKITVAGNDRTALSFFDSELEEIKADNLSIKDMAKLMSKKTEKLLSMDMFEAVDTNLEIATGINGKYTGELKLNVKEKGIPFLKVATYLKAGTGSEVGFEIQSALRNPVGYGETFKVTSITTQTGAKEFFSTLSVPNVGPQKLDMNVSLRSSTENMSFFTAYQQQTDAFGVEFTSRDKKHQLVGEYALRDEIPLSNSLKLQSKEAEKPTWSLFDFKTLSASAVTTNTAMASVKTSLKYLCTMLDSRDSASNPSSGSFLQGSVEVAAPPGKNAFFLSLPLLHSSYVFVFLPNAFG